MTALTHTVVARTEPEQEPIACVSVKKNRDHSKGDLVYMVCEREFMFESYLYRAMMQFAKGIPSEVTYLMIRTNEQDGPGRVQALHLSSFRLVDD